MKKNQKKPGIIDLGYANSWGHHRPDIVRKCRLKHHHRRVDNEIRRFVHEVWCDICGYKYRYDSSG